MRCLTLLCDSGKVLIYVSAALGDTFLLPELCGCAKKTGPWLCPFN